MTDTMPKSTGAMTAQASAAAQALAAALPVSTPVTPQPVATAHDDAIFSGAGHLAAGSFVGQANADLAVHLDPSVLGDSAALDPTLVAIDDVLRPALEAAVGVLGNGVLSNAPADSAQALLDDERSAVFILQANIDGQTRAAGWFAVRLRDAAQDPASAVVQAVRASMPADSEDAGVAARLNRLNNVQMGLTVEIGRTRVSVRDVLALEPGAVIELDRNAGAPADVRLNGRLIAQGEVVVMDQDYGVRITRILDAAEGIS